VEQLIRLAESLTGWDRPAAVVGLAAGLVCVLWAGALAAWVAWWLTARRRRWRRFLQEAMARGFGHRDARSLWLLGRFAGSPHRLEVLRSVEVFDRCVLEARKTAGDDLLSWPELLTGSRIDALRRKYTSGPRSRHSYTTTRHIEPNQPVRVITRDGAAFDSFVLRATEEGVHLASPREPELRGKMAVGQEVRVLFWRPSDARYEVRSRIIANGARHGQSFLVAHADLRRVQEREFVRVRCRNEVWVLPCGEEARSLAERDEFPGPGVVGLLRDLSLGGASFTCEAGLPAGSWVLLRLRVEAEEQPLILAARVVRQRRLEGTSSPVWLTSVNFPGLAARKEHRLGRFVSRVQQGLIRRMLVRAGGPGGGEAPFPQPHRRAHEMSGPPETKGPRGGASRPDQERRPIPAGALSAGLSSGVNQR